MKPQFNTTGAAFDSMSSEPEIRTALTASAAAGDMASVAQLEEQAGVHRGRLVEDFQDLVQLQNQSAPDGHIQLALDELKAEWIGGAHLVFSGATFWAYGGGVWRTLSRNDLKKRLLCRLIEAPAAYGDGKANTIVAGALCALETLRYKADFPSCLTQNPPPVINTANHEIWLFDDGDSEARPHRSWTRSTAISPVHFDPEAECPRFDEALAEIFSGASDPPDMIRHMLEVMGYGIQPRRQFPSIVILRGAGANGKSALLKIWSAMLAENQVLWGSVARLSADKFTLPALAGSRLFVDDDAKDGVRLDDGLLKSIAEDKPVSAREAHAAGVVSFRALALPVISTNGAPSLSDSSHGFERRLLVVPFERRFTEAEMDRTLADRIIAEEMPGVLNRLLEAYRRLCLRGRFEEPADCQKAKVELLAAANPMRAFISQACRPAPGMRATTADLYAAFRAWCRSDGRKVPYTRIVFTQRLRAMGFNLHKSIGRNCVEDLEIRDASTQTADEGDF